MSVRDPLRIAAMLVLVALLVTAALPSSVVSQSFGQFVVATRGTLLLSACVLAISVVIGALGGLLASFGPKLFDALLARAVELGGVLPTAIAVALATRRTTSSFVALVIVLGALRGVATARLVRGEIMRLSHEPFVEGARALGVPPLELFRRHILPHLAGPVSINAALTCAYVVGIDAALGFLGLAGPDVVSWGALLGNPLHRAATAYPLSAVVLTTAAAYALAEVASRKLQRTGTQALAAASGKSR